MVWTHASRLLAEMKKAVVRQELMLVRYREMKGNVSSSKLNNVLLKWPREN